MSSEHGEGTHKQLSEDGEKIFYVNSRNQVRPKSYRRRLKKAKSGDPEIHVHVLAHKDKSAAPEAKASKYKRVDSLEKINDVHDKPENTDSNDALFGVEQNIEMITDTVPTPSRRLEILESTYNVSIEPENLNSNDMSSDELNDDIISDVLDNTDPSCNEHSLIDLIKEHDGSLLEHLMSDLAKANNWENDEIDTDSEVDNANEVEPEESGSIFLPLSPGHTLTLKTSILMIWMYAIAHCLTASQLSDLLTLINLHLMISHPVYSSLHRFKRVLNKDFSSTGMKKHFFCSLCYSMCSENDEICSNEICSKQLDKNCRAHFIELNIVSQWKNLFKRDDFVYGIGYRSRRKKFSESNIEDIYDGQHYKHLFAEMDQSSTNLSFIFNTDGVPIFKSSKTSIWPIFLMINELPYKMRTNRDFMLLAGLWCGPTKPVMNLFLSPTMKSLHDLETGVEIENKIVKGFLHSMSCDLPARSAVLNINNHNGEYACMKCSQSGVNHRTVNGGNIRVFPYNQTCPDGPSRSHDDVLSDAQEATVLGPSKSKTIRGIKGPSVLMFCPKFDCVKGIAIDYMHMLCLGLVRMLMNLWFNVANCSQVYSVYAHIKVVDDRLSKIKVPYFITRTPRSISEHLKFWKASELRSWFFYYSVPCLYGLLQPPYLYHFFALVQAMFLLNQSSISTDDLTNAERLLHYFVFMLPTLYGEKFVTLNAHSLLHLPQMVKELGPLWCYSCFAFEGANGELIKMFHGTQFIDLQIANAVHIYQLLPTLSNDINSSDVAYKFVKSLTNVYTDKELRAENNIVPLGKPYKKQLDFVVDVQVREFMGNHAFPLDVDFYSRLKINGQIFHSKAYTRVYKRN